MSFFRAKSPLDKAFEVTLLLKGLHGLDELLSGVFFLVVSPDRLSRWVERLTAPELREDPNDFVAKHLFHWAQGFTKAAAVFAGLYLLAHGIIKLVLVLAILRDHLWAYPGLIIVTAGFAVYQMYHIVAVRPTFGFVALTIFDLVVIYLTAKEYGKQKQRLQHLHHHPRPETE